ncbi:hypothetical protein DH2020_020624 [Rehmannia glutinosa]|uniref:Transmembrane protein n=1 Tax=Rehmannia glutinosa TaxID=99300 RepID=A0ABR0WKS9_REHGL
MEEDKSLALTSEPIHHAADNNHGWQKVTYAKKQRKTQNKNTSSDLSKALPNGSGSIPEKNSVFKGLEKHAEERRRKLEAQRASAIYDDDDEIQGRPRKNRGGDEDDDYLSSDADVKNNVAEVTKKEKPKKVKTPKVTVAEAAAKIDADDLAAFLSSVSESYEGQQDIQLMRFADYFGRAFSTVSASQFPWLKLFRESAVAKIADVPVSYISEAVYKTSVDWINHRSPEALGTFVVWSLDGILADLAAQQSGTKGSKKGGQTASSKSQVAIFLVLAMVLRRKPDVLINLLPKLSENSKYQGQDKLPVVIWMIVQATERFEVIYPLLKEVALAGSPGSKAMKQVSLQIQALTVKAAGEGNFELLSVYLLQKVIENLEEHLTKLISAGIPALSEEAAGIFLWCLTQNPDCYKQWDKIYVDNIEASVAALKKLSEHWKELSSKQSSLQALGETLKSFRQKNEKALSSGGVDVARQAFFKDADKYCKAILGRLSSGHACLKTAVFTIALLAVGAAVVSPNLDAWDWNKLSVLFNQQSF